MNHPLINLLLRWVVMALGVAIAAYVIPGISYSDGMALIVAVVLLSFFNAVIRPLLLLFTLPFIIISMGFGVLVINALLFLLVGKLVSGFHVDGFWPAMGGSLIVSITNLLLSRTVSGGSRRQQPPPQQPPRNPGDKGGDVIDI